MRKFTRKFTNYLLVSVFALNLLLVFGSRVLAQAGDDDPRYDHIPQWLLQESRDNPPLNPSSVITINGWDNFFLGVDFAEGNISENPKNTQQYFTAYNTNGTHHTENGHDWGINNPSFGASVWGDPVSAYDSLGNLYYMNMYGGGSIQGCKVVKSSDNGQTWGTAVNAISGVDKNWICADQTGGPYSNYIYCTMTSNSGGNLSRSTDLGATFQNTATFSTQSLPGMMACVGPEGSVQGGAVYVVTNGGSSFASTYTFYKSTNGGQSFTQKSSQNFSGYVGSNVNGRNSVQNMRTRPYPFIGADNSYGDYRGRLYLVYASNDPPGNGNKPDIFSRYSDDGGTTWSAAVKVNDDFNTAQNNQWQPAMWCDKETGRLYVQWMDTRDTPSSDSALIYATYSDDGGQTFMPNQQISNKKMKINCPTCGGGGTPAYQGDYNGMTSNNNVGMANWGDFRSGSFGSFTAYFPDYAMLLEPATLSMSYQDTVYLNIPEVKLYDDIVVVSASIQTPPSGTLSFSYPNGFTLNSVPGTLPIVVTADNVPVGNYALTVTAKGPNGTPVHKRISIISIVPGGPPLADFTADTTALCAASAVNFNDLSTNGPTEWEWSFPGGTPSTSTDQNPSGIVYDTPGVYSVSLTATNNNGSNSMTKTDYITVYVVPDPPTSSDVEVCEGETVPDLEAVGDNILWYDDPTLINPVFEGNIFPTGLTDPGTYLFYITQSNDECTSEALTVVLTINPLPEVSLDPLGPFCEFDEGAALNAMPAGGEFSGDGIIDGVFYPAEAGVGTHTISYTYTNEFGCTNMASQDITVNPTPLVDLGGDASFCEGSSVSLDAGAGYDSYLWNTGATTQSIDVDQEGTYSVVVSNEFGCFNGDTIDVMQLPLPLKPSVASGPASVDNFMQTSSDYMSDGSSYATSYMWMLDPATAGTISGSSTTGTVTWTSDFTGTASVSIKAVNDCGESDYSDVYTVEVYSSQGLDEINQVGIIRIFPNPNKGAFTLEINTKVEKSLNIRIMDALGKVLIDERGVNVNTEFKKDYNLGNVSATMLILKVDDGKNSVQKKINIE